MVQISLAKNGTLATTHRLRLDKLPSALADSLAKSGNVQSIVEKLIGRNEIVWQNRYLCHRNSSGQGVIPDRRYSPQGHFRSRTGATPVPTVKSGWKNGLIMISTQDIEFMRRAMSLAQCGEGAVNPNPLVGAIIVRGGKVLANGFQLRTEQKLQHI